ncbi:MAG: ROK family protein [Lachnospiraceae bacterium]|nr:ROK family protein [Lachnospiraceae bacterium]
MQDNIIGKPNALKQVNLAFVRRAIMEKGSATRAEIVDATKISVTTVRTLLTEMERNNELVEVGFDDSMGGRKATRYKLNENRFFGVAFCLGNAYVRYLIVNICGKIYENGAFDGGENTTESICKFLDDLTVKMEIRSIGIGVPGIVNGMGYDHKNAQGKLENCPIGEIISNRYGVPVILENDLNAIALGFGRCYLNTFPEERCDDINMAYVHFDKDCLSAGFLSGGKILRGHSNFVGELGLFPVSDTQTLDDLLASPLEDHAYAALVAKLIAGICCMLNPQYIALGGDAFRKDCLPLITEYFNDTLPPKMSAEILFAGDKWHDYFDGMAHLTAEQIFANLRLVKE